MYEKKLDSVIKTSGMIGVIRPEKKRFTSGVFANTFAKYLACFLGVVLLLLLVLLISKTVLLSPETAVNSLLTAGSETPVVAQAPEVPVAAVFPKTAVYYHGVRLGEYDGEDVTVAEVMKEFNIVLGEDDVPNYGMNDTLFYGMELHIDEVRYVEETVTNAIPYDVIEVESQTVPKGTRVVQNEGTMGSTKKLVKNKYVNGEVVETISEEEIYTAPVDEVILVGVGGVFVAPDGKEYNYSYYLDVTATAYTHTGDPTYMGTVAEVGVIAVDPRNIALGSDVYVIGGYGDYGLCRAEDIGGGIKGLRIDVFLDTEAECVRFGRRKMRAYVME